MKAIRVNGEVFYDKGMWHIDLLIAYRDKHQLSDDRIDAMIESNQIEFGSVSLNREQKLEFDGDQTRNSVYTSIEMISNLRGPR